MNGTNKQYISKIIVTSVAIILVAGLGSVFVNLGMNWFNNLIKPSQWIPNFVIPLVWTIIYLSFIIILSLILKERNFNKKTLILLILNASLNVLWCLTFFALHLTFVGNIVIILNIILAFYLIFDLFSYNKTYAFILSIYPIWISIATTLNLCLWILN